MFDINGVFYITICSFRQISLKTKYSTQIQFKIRRHNNLIHRLDSYDKEEDSVSKETQTENVLVFQKWYRDIGTGFQGYLDALERLGERLEKRKLILQKNKRKGFKSN